MGPMLAKLGTKAGPIGAALTAAVGLGVVAGGLLANEVMSGFDRDMSRRQLQVKLGLDQQSVANVSEAVNNAYKNNFGASTEELQGVAESVLKNGLAKADDPLGLQKLIEQFDTVSQVAGYTGEELAAAVGTMVKSGVAKDATAALDLITRSAQVGIDVHGDLLDTLTEYSVQFQKVGIDGQQAMGLINQLMAGGARNSDLAADAIKEFSIRSIDGSKATVDAYTDLGLSADEMMQKLASGGPQATASFDLIVDKLNAIADPVKRDALGVALFGTQWEDLGAAMRNLDPSSAVNALGQVQGATQSASDTLGGGAMAGFESLGRTFEVLRGKFQDFLARAFGPMAQSISTWITAQLPKVESAFQAIMPAISEFFGGLKEGGSILGGQWLDNVRKIWPEVQKLGSAMKDAFVAALPVLKGIATGLGAVVLVAMKISGAVLPILVQGFTFLYQAIAKIYQTVIPPLVAAFTAVGNAAMWLWTNAIQPAWSGISTAIGAAWSVIQTVFGAFKTAISAVGDVFRFVFNDFVLPMWHNLQTVVGAAWSVISPIFEAFKSAITTVGQTFSSVFSAVFTPVWEGIKTAFSTGWQFLSGIFESMKGGFQAVADFIGGVWNGIAGAVKSALDAVVGAIRPALHTIGGMLSAIPQDVFGLDLPGVDTAHALGEKLQAFRLGGTVKGPGGTDNVLAWLTAGEGVVTKQAMANGGQPLVAALNAGWVPPVDLLHAMLPGFAKGSLGVNEEINQVSQIASRFGLTLTSGKAGREGESGSFHSSGEAGDFGGPTDKMLAFAQYMFQKYGSSLAELIFDHESMPQLIDNGKPVSPSFFGQQDHWDHVHVAIKSGQVPGLPFGNSQLPGATATGTSSVGSVSLGSLSGSSSKQDIASAIAGEASRRGYSQDQTAAILSTALQESGLNPAASGGGGAWKGIFQQDSSYPGRNDPNSNIEEFFNRLEKHGGTAGDIWKNIFWLQQRPGEMSADAAFGNGRQGYLTEIQSQLDEANSLLAGMPTAQDYQGTSGQTPDSGTGTGTGTSNNPYMKIMEGINEILPDFGSLAQIGFDGVKETLLPPGFSDPTQWASVKSGGAVLNWLGGFLGGFAKVPGMEGLGLAGSLLGVGGSAITGDASGAVGGLMSLLPAPFGQVQGEWGPEGFVATQQHEGTGALPGPGYSAGAVPDPAGAQTINNDNSVHVGENGTVGMDPATVFDRTQRQQRSQQMPQLGTRRFV